MSGTLSRGERLHQRYRSSRSIETYSPPKVCAHPSQSIPHNYLRLPFSVFRQIEPDLIRLGGEIITSIRSLGDGNKISPPILTQYDQWGRRVDNLQTSEGWRNLKAVAQKEGIPGIFYERKFKENSRVLWVRKDDDGWRYPRGTVVRLASLHKTNCPSGILPVEYDRWKCSSNRTHWKP